MEALQQQKTTARRRARKESDAMMEAATLRTARAADPVIASEPLDAFPLFRSNDADEARAQVARIFCPHELRPVGAGQRFASRHNMLRLGETTLNYLAYGAEVDIDPGPLGNFFLVQIPIDGSAEVECGSQRVTSGPQLASVLSPDEPTRMRWNAASRQVMLHVPRQSLERRLAEHLGEPLARPLVFDVGLSLTAGLTRAWCRMIADLVDNIDQCGREWLHFRPMIGGFEDCLLRGLLQLHRHNYSAALARPAAPPPARHVQRAIDYIDAHVEEEISVGDVARAACISVRALEEGFRRDRGMTPLAYLRNRRLERVRETLRGAAASGADASVTEIAQRHGFAHLGRFSAYYRERFGESPSETLRSARFC